MEEETRVLALLNALSCDSSEGAQALDLLAKLVVEDHSALATLVKAGGLVTVVRRQYLGSSMATILVSASEEHSQEVPMRPLFGRKSR